MIFQTMIPNLTYDRNFTKEIRMQLELSQANLARLLDVAVMTVSRWECGTVIPGLDRICSISELYYEYNPDLKPLPLVSKDSESFLYLVADQQHLFDDLSCCYNPEFTTEIRAQLELSQGKLGKLIEVNPLTISRWERGLFPMGWPALSAICDLYYLQRNLGGRLPLLKAQDQSVIYLTRNQFTQKT